MGKRPIDGVQPFRFGLHRLHGQVQLRPEALQEVPDAHIRGGCVRQPERADRVRPRRSEGRTRLPGSLGIAISEAIEDTLAGHDVKYSLGSVLNHVVLHQTVIGLEAKKQMEMAGHYPDVVVGCVGGGSNFGGIVMPFMADKFAGKRCAASPWNPKPASITRGEYRYDFGDTAMTTPLMRMHTLGSNFVPPAIHAGGLRYHGMAPLVSLLAAQGTDRGGRAGPGTRYGIAVQFARCEGIVPAPESAHAICQAMNEARRAKEECKERVILFNLSGHGFLDLAAYDAFLEDRLASTEREGE